MNPTHLDLFSGIGGFAIAAQNCGYRTVAFCEKEPYAQQILKEKFGAVLADAEKLQRNGSEHHGGSHSQKRGTISESGNGSCPFLHPDIFALNGADYAGVDLITGGFPCQPFSVAGKRRGASDDRALWPEMLRVIDEARPAWVLGENVAGIVTMELDNILSDLETIGYSAWPIVIPACAVDARHRRDRVWIVARAEKQSKRESADQTHSITDCGQARQMSGGRGSHVANPYQPGSQGRDGAELRECGTKRLAGEGSSFCSWPDEQEWFPESPIRRVADGIPHRTHRLRGLGNAIVPQVAEEILRNMIALTTL